MPKRCNNSELLIRIDERVKVLPEMQKEIKEIKGHQIRHHYRIKDLEKSAVGYQLLKIIRFFIGR